VQIKKNVIRLNFSIVLAHIFVNYGYIHNLKTSNWYLLRSDSSRQTNYPQVVMSIVSLRVRSWKGVWEEKKILNEYKQVAK